jgi:putative molybdopterin biosynthesis protein
LCAPRDAAERVPVAEQLTTKEVAAYLRISERRVYELVRRGTIPCTRVTGKLLFPRALIDRWLAAHLETEPPEPARPPGVLAGSDDPLLAWAVTESESGLAVRGGGSLDGLRQVQQGRAAAAGLHIPERGDGFNTATVAASAAARGCVLVTWAWRRQGLVLPPGNPDGVTGLADVVGRRLPVIRRQRSAGSDILLTRLLDALPDGSGGPRTVTAGAHDERGLARAVLTGRARAGVAVEAAARELGLAFVPLAWERFDLLLDRRAYFEPPLQTLLSFAHSDGCAREADRLGGYDRGELGVVQWVGP